MSRTARIKGRRMKYKNHAMKYKIYENGKLIARFVDFVDRDSCMARLQYLYPDSVYTTGDNL